MTKSGVMVKDAVLAGVGIVAVDPGIIELGSHLWVEGYGEVVAADTGEAIKGNRIDIYMEDKDGISGHERALEWGRKMVKVKIIN